MSALKLCVNSSMKVNKPPPPIFVHHTKEGSRKHKDRDLTTFVFCSRISEMQGCT